MSSKLTQHPLSAAFPAMSADELTRLTDDISTNGQRTPIVALGVEVLDGWHRYQACTAAGLEPVVEQYQGDDPAQFVLSLNLHRRHLTDSQRAAAVVLCADWRPTGVTDQVRNVADLPKTARQLAEKAHVSTRTIEHAKAAVRAGRGADVRDGKVSASKAAGVVRKPAQVEPVKPPEADEDEAPEGFDPEAELHGDYEAVQRLLEADDKLAAAWDEVKTWIAKYEELDRLYAAQRVELATMTAEAKRHMRRADALEKKLKAVAT